MEKNYINRLYTTNDHNSTIDATWEDGDGKIASNCKLSVCIYYNWIFAYCIYMCVLMQVSIINLHLDWNVY